MLWEEYFPQKKLILSDYAIPQKLMLAEVKARREKKQAWEEVKTETIKCQDLRNLLKNLLYPLKVSIIIPHKNFAENILISIAS